MLDVKLPQNLSITDPELCSVLSNALENALKAMGNLENDRKWVSLYCGIRLGKLLIEVKNPYDGEVVMKDGLPVSDNDGHGFGTVSIRAIAERRGGICTFKAEESVFEFRFMLPIKNNNTF